MGSLRVEKVVLLDLSRGGAVSGVVRKDWWAAVERVKGIEPSS
jgi:hypothetical protein